MKEYETTLEQEKLYLESVTDFLIEQIQMSGEKVKDQKKTLLELRKEMFAEGVPAADDYERGIELNQYKMMEAVETSQYTHKLERLNKYKRIIDKPYFGRFDFQEDEEEKEKVYIGYHNVMNDETYEVLVYDWRAPIASVFYRNELGRASYHAPCGEIEGEVFLKRQYEIERGELKYFFDCSLTITDELLKDALGHNASSHMKNIVETIQKEQDLAIRDKTNDLLIVQGVAGSGKTSIAMHRIAFLLYDRINEGLTNNNIVIISPNQLFGEYIASVLPELGEENVSNLTMEEIFAICFGSSMRIRMRNSQLEYMITNKHRHKVRSTIAFKGSSVFIEILDRLIKYYEEELVPFEDIYYAGKLIERKEDLKAQFLDNAIGMAIGKRLDRIQRGLIKKINILEKEKRKELMKELEHDSRYAFEEERECNTRLSALRQEVMEQMKQFTKVNVFKLYEMLFKDKVLFKQLSQGLKLPKHIENMCIYTARNLREDLASYEDGMALLYLKLKIEGRNDFPQIKQVLVDEAQDYYPLHYKILGEVFRGAQYTILGDICQTIEKTETESLYDEIIRILKPNNALKLKLTKSYRSSYEISQLANRLRGDDGTSIAFERHDEAPVIAQQENLHQLYEWMVDKVKDYRVEGFETTAVLCKSQKEVNSVYSKLSKMLPDVYKLSPEDTVLEKGVLVMPIYLAKGLEYDTVIVYEANRENYNEAADKQLLYIAATRALHRLALCYTGELSPFLSEV